MFDDVRSSAGAGVSSRLAALRAASALAVVAAALLSGCAKRDSITVGAVPDDYRTNHPIVIAEQEEVLDLPVAASDHGITDPQRVALRGFLANYDRSASPVLRICPVGRSKRPCGVEGCKRLHPGRRSQWRAEIEGRDHVLSSGRSRDIGAHSRGIHRDESPDRENAAGGRRTY